MAFFGQQPQKDDPLVKPESRRDPMRDAGVLSPSGIPRRMEDQGMGSLPAKPSESILSAGLTIEGKIEGSGNVRVSGRFKGNINVKGEFTVEQGASIEGEVNADAVLVGGEVRGQIVASSRVEFRESGVLIGDLKAGSLTVAAGSKMRGKVEFGWKEGEGEETSILEGGQSALR